MNKFQGVESGKGLLKDQYLSDSGQDKTAIALKKRGDRAMAKAKAQIQALKDKNALGTA